MKPIWTILITVVATAAIVGGGTYYLANKSAEKDKSDLQAQIDDLDAKVSGTTVTSGETVTSGATVTDETAGWKTYTNTELGFSFKYPADWISVEDNSANYNQARIAIVSPETNKSDNMLGYDIIINYYPTVADESRNKARKLGATSLNELISKDSEILKIGEINLGNVMGIDYISIGMIPNYEMAVERNNHLYNIAFANNQTKESLTSVEKQILSTFQFTK
jgi:hypothetical protein